MQVKVAKSAGFCFGVQRAVDTVYEQVEKGIRPIYTYGPIIHNEVVVQDLEEKGVRVLDSKEELEALTEGTVIIRSHGVGREIYDLIQKKGLTCVDATCPFVKKIHRTVEKESVAGRQIIIIGNDKHPEVEGIKGWCHTPAIVVESSEQAEAMIVIGGSHSSNTQKLFEICRKECENTYYIQTVDDLNLGVLRSTGLVGITAGASTPKKIIEEVQKRCQN